MEYLQDENVDLYICGAGDGAEELKIMADNILFEIKNGPPFVYS